ncbi:MAG: CBS domain-containing protein [Clostridiales bacterium]|nr:CBS domain-containing protein [Clostridiales bacterium]
MNVAFFMQPKSSVAFLYNDFTVRQALEKMHYHGYTAIPVLDREGHYLGTVSEGDFLWFIVKGEGNEAHTMAIENLEDFGLEEINIDPSKNPSVLITASIDELLMRAMNLNFIPVVDDRNLFIGIVTRKDVIKHFYATEFFDPD